MRTHLPGWKTSVHFNISRSTFDERETFTFRSQPPCLEYVSLLIENALLLRQPEGESPPVFEKLSRMETVIDRYLRLADLSEHVYVFGEADWKPPRHPNMSSSPFRVISNWRASGSSSPIVHAATALVAIDYEVG